jgi:hypothetical protein
MSVNVHLQIAMYRNAAFIEVLFITSKNVRRMSSAESVNRPGRNICHFFKPLRGTTTHATTIQTTIIQKETTRTVRPSVVFFIIVAS